jgi:hypothetical protein
LNHHPVVFLADGERIAFDPAHKGSVGKGYVLEFLWVQPTKSQLLQLIHAKTVDVKVAIDEFRLMQSHINALKDFCAYLRDPSRCISSPEAKRWMEEARDHEANGRVQAALYL